MKSRKVEKSTHRNVSNGGSLKPQVAPRTQDRRVAWRIIAFAALFVLIGCEVERGPEPPVMYWGQHECDVCRMIISEDRFAAALVIETSPGQYEHRRFDDIGCLFQFEMDEPDDDIAARYVCDARSGKWLDAESAVYLHSMSLKTPMAFHLAACESHEQAALMQQEHAGDVIDFNAARERFKAGTLRDF